MNYYKIYNQLIERAQNRVLFSYKEKHHIVPKCVGGGNNFENLVELTAREHFIAHLLLLKIYPNKPKIWYAYWLMCNRNNIKSGRIYEEARKYTSENMRKIAKDPKVIKRISDARKGKIPKNIKILQNSTKRAILEFENGIIVREYESCAEASRILGLNSAYISSAIKNKSKNRKFPNKKWEYKDGNPVKKANNFEGAKGKNILYKIEKYDIYGKLIKVYENIKEAALDNNMKKEAIRAICLENSSRSLSNFIFKYKK